MVNTNTLKSDFSKREVIKALDRHNALLQQVKATPRAGNKAKQDYSNYVYSLALDCATQDRLILDFARQANYFIVKNNR